MLRDLIDFLWANGLAFVFILCVVVFIHELGHYLAAKRAGVRVEVFSLGFGPELFGWNDRSGTRWRVSLLPLGGYVKMFGESAPTDGGNRTPEERERAVRAMTPAERKVAFVHKSLGRRAGIVAAGPFANFVLAWIVLAALFMTVGRPFTPPEVGEVTPDSAAQAAGLRPGDVFVRVGGEAVSRFEDVRRIISLNPERPLDIVISRDGHENTVNVVPQRTVETDNFGNRREVGRLGVSRAGQAFEKLSPASALAAAGDETYQVTAGTLQAIGQIVTGTRSTDELGGPIRIAQMSSQAAQSGMATVWWFLAVLSINLGLINLFPVPLLDGGHLLFYGFEAVRGRPLSERTVEYGFRVGLGLVVTLFLFVTYQDLSRFQKVVDFFRALVS
ncbi:MAG: RIP metalloprotease RseP [Gemmatimonas sp.]